jgi:microcystin-dependent protein
MSGFTTGDLVTAAELNSQSPSGAIVMFGGAVSPSGWLLCDGAAVSRTTYSGLWAAIGDAWGVGDGTSTFNLPNMTGRTALGIGTLGSDTYALADDGGEARHALTVAELAAHTHTGPSHLHTNSSHSHAVDPPSTTTSEDDHTHTYSAKGPTNAVSHGHDGSTGGDAFAPASNATPSTEGNPASSTDTHDHTLNIASFTSGTGGGASTGSAGTGATASTGSGTAHENRQPFAAMQFIIRA